MAATGDGEQKVLATAKQIVKSLQPSTNADEIILLFSSIDTRLANLSNLMRQGSSSSHSSASAIVEKLGLSQDVDFAMAWLEDNFRRALIVNTILFNTGRTELFRDALDDLRAMAAGMIRAGYEKECCQVYSSVRRNVLEESMPVIGVENLSIEDVQGMDWKSLDKKMKKWTDFLEMVVRVFLTREKRLNVDIFPGPNVVANVCFVETTKGCLMQILGFGKAVAVGSRSAEKLFRILDMFEALSEVFPDLQELYRDKEAGDMLCTEAQGVLDGLREAAIETFVEFEDVVRGDQTSRSAMSYGEIHPLTRYVMNYVTLLSSYSTTLNDLFENVEEKVNDTDSWESETTTSPNFAPRVLSLVKSLEKNLEEKAGIYEDGGLKFVFLMNNTHYMVQKVMDSELRSLLGDNWIRRHRGQIRQHATGYLRASWTMVLSFLRDQGIGFNASGKVDVLKERLKSFNSCFEDVYRIQTAWKVSDMQLKDELKISILEKLIPAYRSFMGRFAGHIESEKHSEKFIKYTSEDLDTYVSHLFEGAPQVLLKGRRHIRRYSR